MWKRPTNSISPNGICWAMIWTTYIRSQSLSIQKKNQQTNKTVENDPICSNRVYRSAYFSFQSEKITPIIIAKIEESPNKITRITFSKRKKFGFYFWCAVHWRMGSSNMRNLIILAVFILYGNRVICAQNYTELLETIGVFYYSP